MLMLNLVLGQVPQEKTLSVRLEFSLISCSKDGNMSPRYATTDSMHLKSNESQRPLENCIHSTLHSR